MGMWKLPKQLFKSLEIVSLGQTLWPGDLGGFWKGEGILSPVPSRLKNAGKTAKKFALSDGLHKFA